MRTITINKRTFEVVKSGTKLASSIVSDNRYSKQWCELYKRPSAEKEKIQEDWENWFKATSRETDGTTKIKGYIGGVQTFSIYGLVDAYPVKITPCHNYIVCDDAEGVSI